MKNVSEKITGNYVVNEDTMISGMVTGCVNVEPFCTLKLSGMICKDLTVLENASVYLHGRVSGDVYNRGGVLKIYGTISKNVYTISGDTFIDENAMINNKV